ncbi:Tn7 transposase TnsA N-terminal domain-containing protein [Idiomarina abyssalis]|uniref:Tn7 transposase TnsA N-terminal domain-containing protein n=1 Tax=Idiomarina abyssalis TaxID=86102 RepID=UPI003A939EB6
MDFKTPVRKIKPTRRSVSGYFSFRGKEPTPYESTLERDFVMRMDYDRSVERVVSQPARLFYIDANRIERRYTPDYLVYFTDPTRKPLLVEVKEKQELDSDFHKLRYKFSAAFAFAKQNEWTFKIYDERRIRDPILKNLQLLRNFASRKVSNKTAGEIGSALLNIPLPISVQRFIQRFNSERPMPGVRENDIWRLALSHKLELNLSEPLSEGTLIVGVNDGNL